MGQPLSLNSPAVSPNRETVADLFKHLQLAVGQRCDCIQARWLAVSQPSEYQMLDDRFTKVQLVGKQPSHPLDQSFGSLLFVEIAPRTGGVDAMRKKGFVVSGNDEDFQVRTTLFWNLEPCTGTAIGARLNL